MNQVQLVGRLARDPEARTSANGNASATFTVAVNRRFKHAQGVYEADFINCVAWRQTAEFITRYFTKGQMIGVTGSIQTRSYDAQDGSKRYVTEVLVENAEFVGGKNENGGTTATKAESKPVAKFESADDDELPF